MLANRMNLSPTVQAIIEVVLGLFILIYTIYLIASAYKDGWIIAAIVVGFILPSLFFITAYEKI